MTQTLTRWGDQLTSSHTFRDTPFGTVRLNNFQKVAPDRFTIWMYVIPHGGVTDEEMSVTWWNCHEADAHAFFGIERNEQNMWGS